jgi:HPt (histidine-containing phosphotransfer) domain-containing protein
MSKRSRRPRDEAEPANYTAVGRNDAGDALPADHSHAEPALVVSGAAFQEFDARIDQQLDQLVARWISFAAPAATSIRRVVSRESRRREEA